MRKLFSIASLCALFMAFFIFTAPPVWATQANQSPAPGYKGNDFTPLGDLWTKKKPPTMKFSAPLGSEDAALKKFLNEVMPPDIKVRVCGDCTCKPCGKPKCECIDDCYAIVDEIECCDGTCKCINCCCSDPGW